MIDANIGLMVWVLAVASVFVFFCGVLFGTNWGRIRLWFDRQPISFKPQVMNKNFPEIIKSFDGLSFQEKIIIMHRLFGRSVSFALSFDGEEFWLEAISPLNGDNEYLSAKISARETESGYLQ